MWPSPYGLHPEARVTARDQYPSAQLRILTR
jgi:hypothetical protein